MQKQPKQPTNPKTHSKPLKPPSFKSKSPPKQKQNPPLSNNSSSFGINHPPFSKGSSIYDLQQASWDVTKDNKPSQKFSNTKCSDPFTFGNKHQTNFGYVYSAGGIPVRIEHGNVKLKLKWSIPPENLDYDPTLIICFEGLMETKHPYNFAGKQCVREMLAAPGATEKIIPLLSRLIPPLRTALACNTDVIFIEAMDITEQLSMLVKEQLNPYLHFFLQMINKRSFNMKYKEKVFDLLRVLEMNGGDEALKVIKKKIPTYMSTV